MFAFELLAEAIGAAEEERIEAFQRAEAAAVSFCFCESENVFSFAKAKMASPLMRGET